MVVRHCWTNISVVGTHRSNTKWSHMGIHDSWVGTLSIFHFTHIILWLIYEPLYPLVRGNIQPRALMLVVFFCFFFKTDSVSVFFWQMAEKRSYGMFVWNKQWISTECCLFIHEYAFDFILCCLDLATVWQDVKNGSKPVVTTSVKTGMEKKVVL